jgi:dihydroorotate dehydrogenase electron transfer subunit
VDPTTAKRRVRLEELTLTACASVGRGLYVLSARGEEAAPPFTPGQFVQVVPLKPGAPLLPRPLSILHWESRRLDLLVKVVGRGTSFLSHLAPGSQIRVLGPLGRGFNPQSPSFALVVAGGVGVAPLVPLARRLIGDGTPTVVVYGAATAEELALRWELQGTGAKLVLATEDGSIGHQGDVLEPVRRFEPDLRANGGTAWIAACGPWAMMRHLWGMVAGWGARMEVSLEARMACGVGACLGCAVRTDSAAGVAYACTDGPVFDASSVDWDQSRA